MPDSYLQRRIRFDGDNRLPWKVYPGHSHGGHSAFDRGASGGPCSPRRSASAGHWAIKITSGLRVIQERSGNW
jgi:hypothetical protein